MARQIKIHDAPRTSSDDEGFQVISFVEGKFAGIPFRINSLHINDDEMLEYDYDVFAEGIQDLDKPGLDAEVGNYLIECLQDMVDREQKKVAGETGKPETGESKIGDELLFALDEMFPDDGVQMKEED